MAAHRGYGIASHHDTSGADASHRGGEPGFVRVAAPDRLVWPDYDGNTMFQTLGNIALDPHAGLLFLDFRIGATLQLTGRARIIWGETRSIEFDVDEVVEVSRHGPV